jgi:pyridoxal phosphate enzyme (YggS family)
LLKDNLQKILDSIQIRRQNSRFAERKVTVVAVSKKQPEFKVQEAIEAGHLDFGENHVQSLLKRQEIFPPLKFEKLRWHLIGPLQSNKINKVSGRVSLIHTVFSKDTLNGIQRICAVQNTKQEVLVQVNLSGETSKSGLKENELNDFLQESLAFDRVQVRGLMTMPPESEDPESSRPYFRRLNEVLTDLTLKGDFDPKILCELSMGTSQDYGVAVEEGATLVRLGTSIFGERDSSL